MKPLTWQPVRNQTDGEPQWAETVSSRKQFPPGNSFLQETGGKIGHSPEAFSKSTDVQQGKPPRQKLPEMIQSQTLDRALVKQTKASTLAMTQKRTVTAHSALTGT